jgi:hypothetical protein
MKLAQLTCDFDWGTLPIEYPIHDQIKLVDDGIATHIDALRMILRRAEELRPLTEREKIYLEVLKPKDCVCPSGWQSTHCPIHGTCNCCHGAECPNHDLPEELVKR